MKQHIILNALFLAQPRQASWTVCLEPWALLGFKQLIIQYASAGLLQNPGVARGGAGYGPKDGNPCENTG
jgi:hypothetical protein